MTPPAGETGLILVLAGGLCLHHWPRLLGWCSLAPDSLQTGPLLPRLAFASLALALPSLLYLLMRLGLREGPLRLLLYALLPLLWAVLLARHLPLGMAEAGRLLPVSLAGAADPIRSGLPQWSADPHVVAFCQSVAVLLGALGSLVLLLRFRPSRRLKLLAAAGLVLALAGLGRWLVVV